MKNDTASEQQSNWPSICRVVWLSGGLTAISNPGPSVEVCAGSSGPAFHKFSISAYGKLFQALTRQGFTIIGTTFVRHEDELRGLRPAEFLVVGPREAWALSDLKQKWRQIVFAAAKQNEMRVMDISSRIASRLDHSQLRLLDLAAAYGLQLQARIRNGEGAGFHKFSDIYKREVHKSIHSMFWELAVLRDNLAEFLAVFCFGTNQVTTISGLIKWLKKNPFEDAIGKEVLEITDPLQAGWLALFSSYRDFFTHVSPIESATGRSFAIQDERKINQNLSVPQIYYPLPGNIVQLTRERTQGVFYDSLEDLRRASMAPRDRSVDPDALEYLHSSLNRLTEFAVKVISKSPITPVPIQFTEKDMIGEIKWTPGSQRGEQKNRI